MNYMTFPLSYQNAGSLVVVTLSGVESDVFLVDSANLSSFQRGGQFRYTGGHYKRSPVHLSVPSGNNWTAVVVPGRGGSVRATVSVIPA